MSETTATAVGSPPAPWPEKTTSPPNVPLTTTIFCVPCDHAIGEVSGTSIGATRACTAPPLICARETCRIVQFSSFAYEKSTASTVADRLRRHRIRIKLRMHRNPRQDAQLRPRVEPIDIRRRIRLRIAKLLRIGQHRSVIRARLHAAQDVVARPVHDAAQPRHLVAAKPLQHPGITGTPPATAAPNRRCTPCCAASLARLAPR